MNSPTHSLLALAILSKRGERRRNVAVFIGALIPDLLIYIWAPYQMFIKGETQTNIWDVLYFAPPMQTGIALFNSIPIYLLLAAIGFIKRGTTWGKLVLFFALAALIHMATDFPVHGHDAYRHFWPLSDFRFHSPISYWEVDHHARWVSLVEALIALSAIIVLWRRFPKLWVKIILGVLALGYLALPLLYNLASIYIPS
ncbi:hypothetical protein [Fretibacter rubidus]|uniref:hypothetical protein n=1 Tax=Fretibacter rubidus TaxID=570162 RepID=UPI00352B63A1